jgi:tetratricopeptide (TPR) repeat protein
VNRILEKAISLQQQGKSEEALRVFDAVIGKTIDDSYSLYCAGTGFLVDGYNGVAITLLSQSIQNAKQGDTWIAAAWNNLASALKKEGHHDYAIKAFKSSIEVTNSSETIGNLSGMYINQGSPDEAIALAKAALEIDPYQPQAANHYALALLEKGEYAEGFKWYNARLRLPEFHQRHYPGPMWDGSRVGTLVIHGEQGVGDEIMFSSLIKEAQARVDRVVIECTPKLVKTFSRSFGVPCYPNDGELKAKEKGDAWIAMGSLPALFGIKEPLNHSGYMTPDPERVKYWKDKYPFHRIGISWRGGTKLTHWQYRNFEINEWVPLANTKKMISLQYGDWSYETGRLGIESPKVADFDDHMALVASCDLVISVCNTTVHMAGSMGVPCWCLVPSKPAWRYGLAGDRMFWYPSVKFYRQTGEWAEVINRIRSDLADFQCLPRVEPKDAPGEAFLRDNRGNVRLAYSKAG